MNADKCSKCGRSPWIHYLRGTILYCDIIGGMESSFTVDQVNAVRSAIGKKVLL